MLSTTETKRARGLETTAEGVTGARARPRPSKKQALDAGIDAVERARKAHALIRNDLPAFDGPLPERYARHQRPDGSRIMIDGGGDVGIAEVLSPGGVMLPR